MIHRKITILFACLFVMNTVQAQLPNTIAAEDKVYGLSKFWQEVNYNFIYLNQVDRKAWDNRYKELIGIVQKTKSDYEYYRELQKFCALLKDGHTNVYFPQGKGFETMTTMFGDYRFFIENIDGKAIIVRTNASKKEEIPVGSEVIEVNGRATGSFIQEEVTPYISSSTDYVLQDQGIAGLLKGQEGDTYHLKIKKPGGTVVALTVTHKKTEEQEVFPAFEPNRKLLDFNWQKKNIAYLGLNSFEDKKIDSLFTDILPELYKAKGLIIDLRFNGGGNTNIGTAILKYLTKDSILYGSKSRSRQHIATYKAWGKFMQPADTVSDDWAKKSWLYFNDKVYYDFEYSPDTFRVDAKKIIVPTVILIGHNTASAAEDFLIYADNQKHMKKIGANTFGSTGQPYMFPLPGGGSARICTKEDTYPDGRLFIGYGIKPDIAVKPTVNDYLQKTDPVMIKALDYLQQQLK